MASEMEENREVKAIDGTYRVEAIASLFGLTVRRVQQLTQEGIISTVVTVIDGKKTRAYELAPTIQKYVKYLSDRAYGKSRSEKEMQLQEMKLRAEVSLKESQSELHKMRMDIASGKYIEIDEVKADYTRFFIVFKKFALSIPSRIGGMLNGHCSPVEARALEKDISQEILRSLNSFVVAGIVPDVEEGDGMKNRGIKKNTNKKV